MAATPRDHAGNPLCLLAVHAHPDDEASKGAGTVAKYTAEGIRCVLVCCTGGEAGDILNPAADTADVRDNLAAVRMAELRASVDAIGYSSLHLLGYHDSGMPDTETNARPDNFANAPLEEAVGRLVRIIRAERPQVIITCGRSPRTMATSRPTASSSGALAKLSGRALVSVSGMPESW